MKRLIILIAILSATASADTERVSFLFMHRSVGLEAVTGCFPPLYRNIREILDTMTVVNDADTARIVFRSYNLNYGVMGDSCLSDTAFYGNCGENYNNQFSGYDWELNEREKMIIYAPGDYSPTLTNVFQAPNKENQPFWNVFKEHTITTPGGNVTEKYDLVMVKHPYIIWRNPTQLRMDHLKNYYRAVRDTLANHPEINFCFVFGSPLAYQTGGDDDFRGDSSLARLVYETAAWFDSDDFFTHSNTGPYRNIWKIDTYRPLCETSPDSANRYCLKSEYWAGTNAQSHLSGTGAFVMQEILASFIRQATADILEQRNGGPSRPSRSEIDRIIRDFRDGTATLEQVLSLIARYNSGG